MTPDTFLTAGEAARATGKSVPTITRAIKKGRISARKDPNTGSYEIDPASLFNEYPAQDPALGGKGNVTPETQHDVTPRFDPALQAVIDAHKLTVEQLEARIEEKDEVISDYKTRLAKTDNLLTDERSDAEKARAALDVEKANKPKITRRRLTWRERMFGGEISEAEEVA